VSDDEQKDQKAQRPNLRVVPPARKAKTDKLTVESYNAALDWWLKGTRSVTELARFLGVSMKTARHLVHKGLQRMSLRPLKEAAREHDELQEQARQRALRAQVDQDASELAQARRRNLQVANNIRVLGTELLVRCRTLMLSAGVPSEGQVPAGEVLAKARLLQPVAAIFRSLAISLREAGTVDFAWIKGTLPAPGEDARGDAAALESVTPEQWEHFMRTGTWPPGLSPEVLKALAKQGLAQGT